MKRLSVPALFAASLTLLVPQAQAGSRFHLDALFNDELPPVPDEYFFDDGYVHEDLTTPDLQQDDVYSAAPSVYDYDPTFYEPSYEPSKKRIDRLRQGLKAQANVTPTKKPAAKLASLAPKQPLPTVKTQLQTPQSSLKSVPPQAASTSVSCDKGAKIVGGYGFTDVKPKSCAGTIFAFNATRGGKAYEILLSAKNGALTEVKRQ